MNPDFDTWEVHNQQPIMPVSEWDTVSVLYDDGSYSLSASAKEVDWKLVYRYDVVTPF